MKCNDSVNSSPTTNTTILLWKSFFKMLFNSIFRNVNVTLLYITNTPTTMYAASPEKWSFHPGRGGGWGTRPPLSEFSGSAPGTEEIQEIMDSAVPTKKLQSSRLDYLTVRIG